MPSGGKRDGAGRKPLPQPRPIRMSVTIEEQETIKARRTMEDYNIEWQDNQAHIVGCLSLGGAASVARLNRHVIAEIKMINEGFVIWLDSNRSIGTFESIDQAKEFIETRIDWSDVVRMPRTVPRIRVQQKEC